MKETKQIYDFILAFWRLVKKYTENPPVNDDDWEGLLQEGEQLRKVHNTSEAADVFVKGLIIAWYDYLSFKDKHKSTGGVDL